jgi:DNA-binding HxlR family transcriptional regulator
MRKSPAHVPELCSRFHRASELIGRRWTGAIIFVLLKARCRFATLRDAIPDITDRMLSERLHELEQEGIVARTVIPETPVRVEYELTKKGRALASAIEAIVEWAHKWIPAEAATNSEPTANVGASRSGNRGGAKPVRSRRTGVSRLTT